MVSFINKCDCCGCEACVQVCPQQCISFEEDTEGFRYPQVDKAVCADCGLCEQVCPFMNPYEKRRPIEVLAAINKDDEVRERSSSGGVFSLLANQVIDAGGVVFGVRFDDEWLAVFDCAETREQVAAFRGSKYLQARVGDCYVQCEQFLKDGRQVLFSGTPCQIAGLHRFLHKTHENLLTVDFICHGVPSPKVWEKYLDMVVPTGHNSINNISFRDKRRGWKRFSIVIDHSAEGGIESVNNPIFEDPYGKAFLANLTLRPACYACPAKSGRSHSDITLGDFWGIEQIIPQMDDDRGTSVVIIHTQKGQAVLRRDLFRWKPAKYNDIVRFNPSLEFSVKMHPKRREFFEGINQGETISVLVRRCLQQTVANRVCSIAKHPVKSVKRMVKILFS